jgi:hypothetical protein
MRMRFAHHGNGHPDGISPRRRRSFDGMRKMSPKRGSHDCRDTSIFPHEEGPYPNLVEKYQIIATRRYRQEATPNREREYYFVTMADGPRGDTFWVPEKLERKGASADEAQFPACSYRDRRGLFAVARL